MKLRLKMVAVIAFTIFTQFLSFGALAREIGAQVNHLVWWGKDDFWKRYYSDKTNGVAEFDGEFITDAVAAAAGTGVGFAIRHNGTVCGFGLQWPSVTDMPSNLSNVASIYVEPNACWAIKRDGTVVRWGHMGDLEPDIGEVIPKLTNVISVISAGGWGYLALEKNGTVLGFRLNNPTPLLSLVKDHGGLLTNVVALAPMGNTPLMLKADGAVYNLGYQSIGKPPDAPRYEVRDNILYEYLGGESAKLPYEYTTSDPVMIGGQALSNITAIASSGCNALALKKDGTVVAWGNNADGASTVPVGLKNVIAIATSGNHSMALKQDGTVVCWGNNYFGQSSVPARLTDVIAIAAGEHFNLAITTGSIPASVFINPHGRLEEMEQKADLIFIGEVLSTTPITNIAFRVSSMTVNATKFRVTSVLKGDSLNELILEHYSGWGPHGGSWSGSAPPARHKFETGQSYLVFAAGMEKPDNYYSPQPGVSNLSGVFRQIADVPKGFSDGVMRTLDSKPLGRLSVKEAHWFQLNRLLSDSNPSNTLYAISKFDQMSLKGG